MATLSELEKQGAIFRWEVPLPPQVQVERCLYGSPGFAKWIGEELPRLDSSWNLEETPSLQASALAEIFVSGETLTYSRQFKPLNHLGEGVWELKTADIRLFGWFPMRDVFVTYCADEAWRVKEYKLYRGYVNEVVQFRNVLPLDEPKFVEGENPDAVVSNFYFPD